MNPATAAGMLLMTFPLRVLARRPGGLRTDFVGKALTGLPVF
jgi:hypothetical protein